jgi:CheY-like chemotaxis protein
MTARKEELRILIVEDESIVAKDIQGMLFRLGYGLSPIASRGQEAIEKALEHQPDIILMDIMLKDNMDGIETAKKIREHFSIPIIYMSASSDGESLKQVRKAEPFFFISKPIEEDELQTIIDKVHALRKGSLNSK